MVNWTLRNKLQWKFNRNSKIFIHENAIENVVCEMAAILSQPQCVKTLCAETWILQENKVNIMTADALASCITWSSAAMVSTMWDKGILIFLDDGFQPHVDGIGQDCSISSVLAMEILQSCTKPNIDVFFSGEKWVLRQCWDDARIFNIPITLK